MTSPLRVPSSGITPTIDLSIVVPSSIVNPPASLAMPRKRNPRINDYFTHNRVVELMAHSTRYAFKSETRLARDAGVSKSAVCRLVLGRTSPSFALVTAITKALEKALSLPLDPRDVVSTDGTYPTASVCLLVGCRGCSFSADSKNSSASGEALLHSVPKSPDLSSVIGYPF